ncbi:MAG TPA: hypothetical protein VLA49_16935 [Anaerolineales bacterium]|nr:hypothetical protein [Anaerolineales bacterium]
MNKKQIIILSLVGVLVLTLGVVIAASAVSGAAFTTYNPWVDGAFKDVCKNSQVNCNIYGIKPDVWLNGGPAANGLGPDGEYFFAVLVPGGQPDPNDGGAKNLSDDYDAYTNRQFTVTGGEVSYYGGTHEQDSGDTLDAGRNFCHSPRGCNPDGSPPFIRLFPFADTTNPGGVYILAICSLGADGNHYPVKPQDCKYDAFKVREEGPVTYDFMLQGMTFKDRLPDGYNPGMDIPRGGWYIHISGNGFLGEPIDATVLSGDHGFWSYGMSYTLSKQDPVQPARLTVCELELAGWYQTFPTGGACYELTIDPAAMAFRGNLDFGNWASAIGRW